MAAPCPQDRGLQGSAVRRSPAPRAAARAGSSRRAARSLPHRTCLRRGRRFQGPPAARFSRSTPNRRVGRSHPLPDWSGQSAPGTTMFGLSRSRLQHDAVASQLLEERDRGASRRSPSAQRPRRVGRRPSAPRARRSGRGRPPGRAPRSAREPARWPWMHVSLRPLVADARCTARHLANRAPSETYSSSRGRRPSSPSVTSSPSKPGRAARPLCRP